MVFDIASKDDSMPKHNNPYIKPSLTDTNSMDNNISTVNNLITEPSSIVDDSTINHNTTLGKENTEKGNTIRPTLKENTTRSTNESLLGITNNNPGQHL